MDDAAVRQEDDAGRALTVESEDVQAIYNLLLRRDPEGFHLIEAHRGRALDAYFFSFLDSPEFHGAMLPAMAGRAGLPPYRGRLSFEQLRVWLRSRSIFSGDLTDRLAASRSWREAFRTLMTDPEVLARSSTLKDAGTYACEPDGEFEPDGSEIEGDCEHINVWEAKGWCVNHLDRGEKVTVEILVGGEVVGSAICQEHRRDIQSRIGGDGACGFTFVFPPQVQETLREEQWISVRERATGTLIGPSVAVRHHGPSRLDVFDTLEEELARARQTLERLEAQLAGAAPTLGYHLTAYDEFVRAQIEPTAEMLAARLAEVPASSPAPIVSVVLVLDGEGAEAVSATLESLAAQAFPSWELILAGPRPVGLEQPLADLAATGHAVRERAGASGLDAEALSEICMEAGGGDFVLVLLPGDRLRRDALLEMVIAATPDDVAAVYYDQDSYAISADADELRSAPRLKPGFDLDYLLCDDYIGRAVMFRTAVLAELGGFARSLAAAGVLDLLLKTYEARGSGAIAHCPHVLIHTPAEDGVGDREGARDVVAEHLARTAPGATVSANDDPFGGARAGTLRVRWPLAPHPPAVSIIIPTKDHPELLGPCLASVQASLRDYGGEVEIFVVDNGTADPISLALLGSLAAMGTIRLARYPGPFNWSALNNRAVAEARGEILVFLNNDILMLGPGWLSELVSQALRPDVGAVGARLLYGDYSIQHAGLVIGVAGLTSHESVGQPVGDGGYLGRTQLQHRASAVTGACLATRRDVFERLGGFDEAVFKITFNDIDYCMRATANGLAVVYTPFATMLHFESVSRGVGTPSPGVDDELAGFRSRWKDALRHDIYYNAHFDRSARPFTFLTARRRGR
jgi:O-antigen biosynthesis protein